MNNITSDDSWEQIFEHAEILFNTPIFEAKEFQGHQGVSGATVRYFEAKVKGRKIQFVAKHATLLERQLMFLLRKQEQAIPEFSCKLQVANRDWLVMRFLNEGDEHYEDSWAKKLAEALAKIHATNLGKCPAWLPHASLKEPLSLVYADESDWKPQYLDLVHSNSEFNLRFGKLQHSLEASFQDFRTQTIDEIAHSNTLTLINPDFAPNHWRQDSNGRPRFIDWEIGCYGSLYFDLPNMFNEKTVKYYYKALKKQGVYINPTTFADKFVSFSRYLGFRFLTVGFDHWQNSPEENLTDDYWEMSGKHFFLSNLEIAQKGYPRPELD